MTTYERYRVWLKNGTYETAVATNRDLAIEITIKEKHVKRSDITAVGKATSKGKLFKV
jgi:hypothetical protein